MTDDGHILDDEAAALFAQLEGIDTSYGENSLAESLQSIEREQDEQCAIIVDLLHQVGRYMDQAGNGDADDSDADALRNILDAVGKLTEFADEGDNLLVRYSGYSDPEKDTDIVDYELVFKNLRFNKAALDALVRRQGDEQAAVAVKGEEAFASLARFGIQTLSFVLPGPGQLQQHDMGITLQIMARFQDAVKSGDPIAFTRGGKPSQIPIIPDENGVPDANFTMLAAVNGISPESIESVIQKIIKSGIRDRYLSSFEALFSMKGVKDKLVKPPLEVNNLIWLMTADDDTGTTPEQAQVVQLASLAADSPMDAASMIQAVYGDDYEKIDSVHLGHRLHASNGLLESVEENPERTRIEKEILGNIETRLDEVRDQVIDDLFSRERLSASGDGAQEGILGGLSENLRSMVTHTKYRADARKKLRGIVHQDVELSQEEIEALAKDFQTSFEDCQNFVRLLRSCFNADGRFSKRQFADIVSVLIRYEEKVLEFLWNYLQDAIHEDDRIAFLNSLQLLITRMSQPKKSIGMLLTDFCRDASTVKHSDAKSLMLSSLLVRKYDQALVDVEISPEEILQIDDSVDVAIANYVVWKIDRDQRQFFEKIQTIHQQLIGAVDKETESASDLPLAYLLDLEREAYIFFSMVGGLTGRSIILSAVKEYGNPESIVYQSGNPAMQASWFLKLLRVAVRGLARVGQPDDVAVLDMLHQRGPGLAAMDASPEHQEQIKRILEWATLSSRIIGDTPESES